MSYRRTVGLTILIAVWLAGFGPAQAGRTPSRDESGGAEPASARFGYPGALGPRQGSPSADLPSYLLDVGSDADADPGSGAYLDLGRGLSERQADGERTFRTLDESSSLSFRFRPIDLPTAANGVPYLDAILTVTYRDVVDETNCYRFSSSRSYCRPHVDTRLDYGDQPALEWHNLGGFAGINDDAWKETSWFLEGNAWQTLRAIDGSFELRLVYPDQLAEWTPLAIDAIALEFVDRAAFDVRREADRQARGLLRVDYVESRVGAWRPEDGDFVLFGRNYLERIFPNSVPARSELTDRLTALEVPGEREPVTFAIHAIAPLQAVTVTASDLVRGTARIGRDRILLQLVRSADKRWAYSYDARYGTNPWYLDDLAPFDLAGGTTQQVWATIDVPDDAAPGTYSGQIEVSANRQSRILSLKLDVVNVELGPPDATPYLYHSPYLPGKYFAARREISVRDMADHDVNPIIYLDAQIDPNTFDVDLRNLDEELSQFEALGILPSEPRVGISDNATSLYRRLCPGRDDYAERCDDFDSVYRGVLRTYRAAFAIYGVQPALSFADEPGEDPQRRALSNYLNRLTKEVDLRTWVTYYPSCEKPLAGHQLVFDDLAGDTSRVVPEWLSDDPHVVAHWDFRAGPEDRSANHNDGVLSGGAEVRDGLLWLPDAAARMAVADDPSLDLTEEATVYLWLRPEACLSAYAAQPLAKWSGTADANYVLYFFGDNQGQNPENKGRIGWYANAGGTWSAASGYTHLDCASGMDRWYNVLWVYDSATGGTLYVNGVALPGGHSGTLATNDQPLWLGRIAGAMDDVLILDRALSADEVHGLIGALNDGYDRSQQLRLTLAVTDTAALPATMTLALGDELASDAEMESTKEVLVDGQTIWTASALAHTYELAAVPVGEHLTGGASHTIEVRFTNGMSRREELEVDFVEDAWRRASWSVQGTGQLSHWQDTYRADDSGALGPMDPYLDDRVYAMRYVTPSEASRSRAAGDTFSYYTTYPATQPVILNNRFLNGIYASATGAEGVYIYAYGDWGPQPWDDTETYFADRSGTDAGRRGQNGYQLVLPSWEERMYDTVIYEALREGIEDSRIIATLKGAIARHPGALADEAQRYLDDVLGRPSLQYWPRYMRTDLALPIEQYADRSGDILGDLAGDPTDFGVFDRLRADMLSYIARLEGRTRAGALYLPLAIDGEQLPD